VCLSSLAARGGCQICRSSVFADVKEPVQHYCLHFVELHTAFGFKYSKKRARSLRLILFHVRLQLQQTRVTAYTHAN